MGFLSRSQPDQQIKPGETNPSGVKGETECPSDHDEAYAGRNQCICGAQR